MTLIEFIKESNRIEGIHSEPTLYEITAYEDFLKLSTLSMKDIEKFVYTISKAVIRSGPEMNVFVGNHKPIGGGMRVIEELEHIINDINDNDLPFSPYSAHLVYEKIHPFMDCNGRSGRAIWLWMQIRENNNFPTLGFLHTFYYQTLENSR